MHEGLHSVWNLRFIFHRLAVELLYGDKQLRSARAAGTLFVAAVIESCDLLGKPCHADRPPLMPLAEFPSFSDLALSS